MAMADAPSGGHASAKRPKLEPTSLEMGAAKKPAEMISVPSGSDTTQLVLRKGSAKKSVRKSEVELRWEMEVAAVCQQLNIGTVSALNLELAPVMMNANVLVSSQTSNARWHAQYMPPCRMPAGI